MILKKSKELFCERFEIYWGFPFLNISSNYREMHLIDLLGNVYRTDIFCNSLELGRDLVCEKYCNNIE